MQSLTRLLRSLTTGSENTKFLTPPRLIFQSRRFRAACRDYRLRQEFITPYTPEQNDYVSHCTSLIPCDTMPSASRRVDSLTPCALRGGLLPGDSYKESFLSL